MKNSTESVRFGLDIGSGYLKAVLLDPDGAIVELADVELKARPMERVRDLFGEVREKTGSGQALLGVTGSGAAAVESVLHISSIDDISSLMAGINRFCPDVRTVIEMGKQSQKLLLLSHNGDSSQPLLDDVSMASKCAAGSGSFIDHVVRRLNFSSLEEFARVAFETENPAYLSGRCGVFTESDIVHLYQKGTSRERIAAGVHRALCRNFRSCIARGREIRPPVAFVGGVATNVAIAKYLAQEFGLADDELVIPERPILMGAIGAALRASSSIDLDTAERLLTEKISEPLVYAQAFPLSLDLSVILSENGDRRGNDGRPAVTRIKTAALGVDIGSVSTKAALVTVEGDEVRLLTSHYRRTDGDPLAAVRDTLGKIQAQVKEDGFEIDRIVAGTTGSGRYLTADYIGADVVRNEITAQATGAVAFVPDVETVFEIGGQDSKYIALAEGVIVDFEMNRACAAGCGAFLEKQAHRLGVSIEDFGDYSLKGTRPPDLDWQCAVFSESAMSHYQQNNVASEDLCAGVCLAAIHNYLHKNVGSREIGERICFQGAVAFNKGMVAALESILKKKIVVPPHPHLTGAVGAAVLAYREAPATSRFRGFGRVAREDYEMSSFECKHCANHCDVNVFQLGGGDRYFYNDRCERYSGVHKEESNTQLPDLFAERETLLTESTRRRPTPGAPIIGVPRIFLLHDYFPYFNALLTELGYRVVVSPPTNKQIIQMGVDAVTSEPCFPVKVAHGHVAWLLEQGIETLFLPSILETEQPNPSLKRSQSCPYAQASPDLLRSALRLNERGVAVIAPRLRLSRGVEHFIREFQPLLRHAGRGTDDLERAMREADKSLERFRHSVQRRGAEVLESLSPDCQVFVVIGRPYTLHDAGVNMNLGRKIQNMGNLALPMDFLPLDEEDISDSWGHLYSRQLQREIAAARLIRRDARFRGAVLTYFGCGPDSFGNQFLKDELCEPYLSIQMDEHTADAGVVTRIEAFADTAAPRQARTGTHDRAVRSSDTPIQQLGNRTVWIHRLCGGADILAASLRAFGVNARLLPRSRDEGLALARRVIPEDVCVPALVTGQDILDRVHATTFAPDKEAFLCGKGEGPCRFGMYHMLQRRMLDKMGLEDVPIVTLSDRDIWAEGGLGFPFVIASTDGGIAHDMLEKMLLRTRPRERHAGDADRVFHEYLQRVCDHIEGSLSHFLSSSRGIGGFLVGHHLKGLEPLLAEAASAFAAVTAKDQDERPVIGIVGEYYVRHHDGTNRGLVRQVEALGGEVWLAPVTEYLSYLMHLNIWLEREHWKEKRTLGKLKRLAIREVVGLLQTRDERRLFHAARACVTACDEISGGELLRRGSRYLHPSFAGEAICSLGKSDDFAARGLGGIISATPFNCMPGTIVDSLSRDVRTRWGNIPFLHLAYDGFIDDPREAKLRAFVAQVRDRHAGNGQT